MGREARAKGQRLVHILRPDGQEDDVPESSLVKNTGIDASGAAFVEYRLPDSDVVVHRSVSAGLTGVSASSEVADIG